MNSNASLVQIGAIANLKVFRSVLHSQDIEITVGLTRKSAMNYGLAI